MNKPHQAFDAAVSRRQVMIGAAGLSLRCRASAAAPAQRCSAAERDAARRSARG